MKKEKIEKKRIIVCRCEEVTDEDIHDTIKHGSIDLDEIKRIARG